MTRNKHSNKKIKKEVEEIGVYTNKSTLQFFENIYIDSVLYLSQGKNNTLAGLRHPVCG